MKKGRIILGAFSAVATLVSAFAFTGKSVKGQSATLATFSNGVFHNVNCRQVSTSTTNCPTVTYYTRVDHTNLGVITPKAPGI
jgi:hypothetical protein